MPEGSGFENEISLLGIGNRAMCFNNEALQATESCTSPVSPPPFMVGMAEIEMDQETCDFELVNYVAVVDCGTPINRNCPGTDGGRSWTGHRHGDV